MPKNKKLKILFLCAANSCRSQIAEGFTRSIKGDIIDAYSAGTEPKGIDPHAVTVMKEEDIDISKNRSKHVKELMDIEFDYVITVCGHANETCPFFPGKTQVIHMGFDDPPKLAEQAKNEDEKLAYYRWVRDQIKKFIITIPESLNEEMCALHGCS